uniref:CST complex subunit STN1 n=1 Tax=Schistosoma mansoni TaxID=6183 RepID=A0A5K4F589_SCHMA
MPSSNLDAPPLMRKLLIGQLFHNTDKLPIYNSIRQIWEMNFLDNNNNSVLKKLSWCMLWLQGRITKHYQSTTTNNNSNNFILDDGTGELLIIYELDKSQPVNYKVNIGDYVAVIGKLVQPNKDDNDDKDQLLNCWHILAKSVTHLTDQITQQYKCELFTSSSSSSSSQKVMSNSSFYELSWPLEVIDMTYSV